MTRRALLACLAAAGCAHDRQANGWAHWELTASHDVDRSSPSVEPGSSMQPAPTFSGLVLAGARLHGLLGKARYGYHIGADLAAGSTLGSGGFAYDVALLPVGGGLRLGATSAILLGAGIGAMGAVGTIDDAVTFPVDLTGEFDAGRIRLLTRARLSYVAGATSRKRGSPTLSFADEAEAMLGLRIGHHYESYGYPTGNGYFVGVAYRELVGARFVGLTIGYSLDVATRRPYRRE